MCFQAYVKLTLTFPHFFFKSCMPITSDSYVWEERERKQQIWYKCNLTWEKLCLIGLSFRQTDFLFGLCMYCTVNLVNFDTRSLFRSYQQLDGFFCTQNEKKSPKLAKAIMRQSNCLICNQNTKQYVSRSFHLSGSLLLPPTHSPTHPPALSDWVYDLEVPPLPPPPPPPPPPICSFQSW